MSQHLFGLDFIYHPLKQCARLTRRRRDATLCDGSSWAKRAFGWWPRRHDEVRILCKKKKTVVVLLDNMKNSSSSTVITVSRNCPRAPDDCSMKAGVEPEIPRCSCLPHIRTVQNLMKIDKYRRWLTWQFCPQNQVTKICEILQQVSKFKINPMKELLMLSSLSHAYWCGVKDAAMSKYKY